MSERQGLSRAAFEALSEGILAQSMDGAIVQSNPAACRILGLSPDQLTGLTSLDPRWRAVHEDGSDFPGDDHPAMVCIRTGRRLHDVIMGVHTPENDLRWISINAEPIIEGDKQTGVVVTFRDISSERILRAQLAESEQRYRLLAENSADVIIRIDHGIIEWVSPSLHSVLGWEPEEWVGQSALAVAHPNDADELVGATQRIYAGEMVVTRCRLRAKDGTYRWVEGHGRIFRGPDGQPHGMITTVHDVDVEMKARAYEHRARYDALTGLYNRDETVDRLIAVLDRPPEVGRMTAVAFCDIDDFKSVNDEHGHLAGDAVLHTAAERMSACVRETDHVGRLGGDELLVILDRIKSVETAERVAQAVCAAMREPIETDSGPLNVTMSIGVAIARPGDQVDQVLARADTAMYEAKATGKDRVVMNVESD